MPRIRVSLTSGELEVEGDASFVDKYQSHIQKMLERLETSKQQVPSPAQSPAPPTNATEPAASFGELLHALPKSATGVDQILLAGHYVQESSADKTFSTTDANVLLVEQGIKLGNPSQSMKNNLNAKRVFKVGSRYRVSRDGTEHLASLLKR